MNSVKAAVAGAALLLAVTAAAQTRPTGTIGLRLGVVGSDVAVLEVVPGSAAGDAGIMAGDKLLAVEGDAIGAWTLARIGASLRGEPGTSVTATFQRGEAAPVDRRLVRRGPSDGMIGLRLAVNGPDVAVTEVVPGSSAAQAGIAVGDKLEAVNGRPVGPMTLSQIVARLRGPAGTSVTASFSRGEAAPADYVLSRGPLTAAPAAVAEASAPPEASTPARRALRPAGPRLTDQEVDEELLP